MKTQLHQQLTQGLRLSPLQIRLGKLMGMNQAELHDEISREVEENPALEPENEPADEIRSEEAPQDAEGDYQGYYEPVKSSLEWIFENHRASDSLQEQLMKQLRVLELTQRDLLIARYITGNLDPDGYLRASMQSISDDIAFKEGLEIGVGEIEAVLSKVQQLEPVGVGARNVQESLLLQLAHQNKSQLNELTKKVVKHHFLSLAKHRYERIISSLNITHEEFKQILENIRRLKPRPVLGVENAYQDARAMQITPDFEVTLDDESRLIVSFRNSLPSFRVAQSYGREGKEEASRAQQFLKLLGERERTLTSVVNAVVKVQSAFFRSGDDSDLKPLKLAQLSEMTGLDLSTVSRALSGKYVQTDFGIYPMKYFLVEKASSGEEAVSRAKLMEVMKKIVACENPQAPMNDDVILAQLREKGYNLSRRTVAKYRGLLNIPPARLRKQLE